jgi:hypothetical protein
MSLYRVVGPRAYREHQPNTVFEASLDQAAVARAVARGDLVEIERSRPAIQPERYTPPQGWHTEQQEG